MNFNNSCESKIKLKFAWEIGHQVEGSLFELDQVGLSCLPPFFLWKSDDSNFNTIFLFLFNIKFGRKI
jgi:hypothetical protein